MNAAIREDLSVRVAKIDSLPTIPAAVRPLLDLIGTPADHVDIEKIVESVSLDKTIAAQVLRICNSALYARPGTVESIRGGVMNLGLRRIQEIVFACTFCEALGTKGGSFDPTVFWRHSLGCALVSRKLASLIEFPNPELAYLAGLLHDIGFQVNALIDPERWTQVMQHVLSTHTPLLNAESLTLGYTHCQSGRILAEQWKLPPAVADVIEFHHMSEGDPEPNDLVSIVHISDVLCRMRDMGYGYYEAVRVDLMADPAWVHLAKNYKKLEGIDLALFTFELDTLMDEVQGMVDQIFSMGAVTR
jgi:putative nucleotidyltransferase with HDIG domain